MSAIDHAMPATPEAAPALVSEPAPDTESTLTSATEGEADMATGSGAAPCGPDLDALGDEDYLNFLARVEGVLPPVFAAFDRSTIDFAAEAKAGAALMQRSRDLRVMVLLAKLRVLDRDLEGFAGLVTAMADLLERQWTEVHPAVTGRDVELRRGVLMALDDMPHTVMPLQVMPLFETRNLGRVSYRNHLVAAGTVAPRDNESVYDAAAIAGGLERADLDELTAVHGELARLEAGLKRIAASFSAALGPGHDLALPNLLKLVGEQAAWLGAELARRDPGATLAAPADEPAGHAEAAPTGAARMARIGIAGHSDAAAALDAVADYLARNEPSSVGLLLVRQCRQLAGVSFLEAIRTLVPNAVEIASIRVGQDTGFNIPIERLGAFDTSAPPAETDEAPDGGAAFEPADPFAEGGEAAGVPMEGLRAAAPPAGHPFRRLATRAEANDTMAQVAQFYRAVEPSSPLPLLLDRARGLAGRDFLTILEEMLPASHLRPAGDD